ncbi:serine/threonine protein kinase [Scheffersomyces coipomensis]|uniref:serine/threonine protein kinase n=1 Tax=Scheffersomyces coipomensis TaxID=1788519 RepID=UPI00315CD55D
MEEYEKYDHGALLRGRYQKSGDISEGSYGLVSLAKDTLQNNTLVAVKFIFPLGYKKDNGGGSKHRPSSSPARLKSPNLNNKGLVHSKESILNGLYEEAEKEIKIHKILGTHANISTLYDHFDSYLILEYCTRGDLYEAIHNNNGPNTSQDIKDVFMQILNALEFCHSYGVYHRDLKPENILIGEDWSIKLCDWGLATTTKIITDKDEFDIGSERYMAPELFDSDLESYDASKIDLWSIGVILLTLVFHKNPFQVANYSDKRFIQFAGNREALFDIFSSMSGDMFSVLRVCLNIDPANRSLENTRSELEVLRFFTVEEEYYGSDYEEDEAEIEDEGEEEDYTFKKNLEIVEALPQSPIKKLISSVIENDKIPQDKVSSSLSTTDNDSIRGDKASHNHGPRVVVEDFPIPHNHRADALLSSNTDLKPIPIGSFGGANKQMRNTRKPFNVASYNQSHNARFQASKFNREDFFTPKSVFNHYMDKYGEQRFNNIDNKINSPGQTNADGKRRKVRSWKKNNRKNKPSSKAGRNSRHEHSHLHPKDDSSSHSHQVSNKRKSRSFSASKARKPFQQTLNANGTTTSTTNSNAIASTFHSLGQPGAPYSYGSSATSTGKYAPPHLRSPNYAKSPVIEPLTEEIERLNLNDYDEVFHLEDDFDLGDTGDTIESEKQKTESDSSSQSFFKKPAFKTASIVITDSDKSSITVSNDAFFGNGSSLNGLKSSAVISKRPVSMQESISNLSSSANSSNGKYVPPFRRGSASSGSQPIGSQQHVSSQNAGIQPSMIKIKPFDKKHKDDIGHGKFFDNNIGSPIMHGTTSGTSSSLNPSDLMYYRKDWSDYV